MAFYKLHIILNKLTISLFSNCMDKMFILFFLQQFMISSSQTH